MSLRMSMPETDAIPPRLVLDIDSAKKITFASAQNATPILRAIRVENKSDAPVENLLLTLRTQPAFCREKQWTIDRVGPKMPSSF